MWSKNHHIKQFQIKLKYDDKQQNAYISTMTILQMQITDLFTI